MVVLNFSDAVQFIDIPVSTNGQWVDLLNADATVACSGRSRPQRNGA
jgi:hypothetical protein